VTSSAPQFVEDNATARGRLANVAHAVPSQAVVLAAKSRFLLRPMSIHARWRRHLGTLMAIITGQADAPYVRRIFG
jgi:hypothetical protein